MDDDMSKNIFAFTIYNGSVFINEKYIQIVNNNNDLRCLSSLDFVFTTLFHEFIHFLVLILSKENNSNSYFL